MPTAAEFQAKVTKSVTNMDRLDGIVNGGPTVDVATDGGVVPSIAKVVREAEATIDQAVNQYGIIAEIREQVSGDRVQTGLDRTAVSAHRAAAQSARDVALLAEAGAVAAGDLYPTTAAGLAATTDGGYFSTVETGDTFATLYQKVGGVAVEKNKYPSKAALGQINPENLFQNADFSQGNPNNVLVPNDALDSVGLTRWVAQQTGLNPFVSVQRFLNDDGAYTLRMINGLPSFGTVVIGTGTKTFPMAPGLNFAPGIDVVAAHSEDPVNHKMSGTVASYNAVTGALVLNVTTVTGSGTYSSWYIGRNGVTTKSTPVYNTVSANVASGATVIPLASTATIEIGANVEEAVGNGIAKATYVVDKSTNSITISTETIGPIASGYQITTYGDQGWYLYQNIASENAGGFKNGTPGARTSYLTFKVKSFGVSGVASLMALGYSSLYTLGRAYADTFPVSETETQVTVPILGDAVGAPGTWQAGYDATDYPYLTVGLAWVSRGTNTSKNLPPRQWLDASPSSAPAFASAGAQGQTLDLASVVGAWVEISEVRFGFGPSREYYAPTAMDNPTAVRHVRAPANPRVLLEATRNASGDRKSQLYLNGAGDIVLQSLSDDESVGTNLVRFGRDGTIRPLAYPDGRVSVIDNVLATQPDAFTPYSPGVVASVPGATPPTFGARTGCFQIAGKRVFVQLAFPVINIGTASGFLIADLPIAAAIREYTLTGFDTGQTGAPVFGRIIPGEAAVQIKLVNGAFPATNGSIMNLSGWYETA